MRFCLWLLILVSGPVFAQTQTVVLVDGPGPWRDDRWALAVTEFSALLQDAGYTVQTVSPVDLPTALMSSNSLLAAPSLESLPINTFNAIVSYMSEGGNLMATGGQPFRDPLYPGPNGVWLDAAAYQQVVGSPPQGSFLAPYIQTLSPWPQQYTNSAGLQVPLAQGRGIMSNGGAYGRYRVFGDLLAPAATQWISGFSSQGAVIWLPWPHLSDPLRAELVTALHAAQQNISILSAGPAQIVYLPGEDVAANVSFRTGRSGFVGEGTLQWSIAGPSGVAAQPAVSVAFDQTSYPVLSLDLGILPAGEYTLSFHLMAGNQEIDHLDSPVRVLDPVASRRPDQKIRVVQGKFYAGGQRVFLQGVNYWPRNTNGLPIFGSWLSPEIYDPDLVEADLSLLQSLHFNLVNIRYVNLGGLDQEWQQEARSLIDFLERCRNHGIWTRIDIPTTTGNNAFRGNLNPLLLSYLQAAYLPGNDRVFSYEVLWEPFLGLQNKGGYGGSLNGVIFGAVGRTILDSPWRAWVNDQYGSLANAEQIWGLSAPRDSSGQLTNPTDDQMGNDGPWRTMVAAYRRFADDYLGGDLGVISREIHGLDPDTLLTYRNGSSMTGAANSQMAYDLGTGAAHLDFFSPENYDGSSTWPDDRKWGTVTAYSRYRNGGKPVQWAEFGWDIGSHYGTPVSHAAQATLCDTIMRQVADDGSDAATVWWWPGGVPPLSQGDYGIIEPDGTLRDCALVLSQWATTFAATPPDMGAGSPITLKVDRDADARGSYGLFLNWNDAYVQARQAGQPVVLADAGYGTDTSSMPVVQVGNAPYAGVGPLKFANAEFGGVRVLCANLDVTVENGAQVQIPPGAACQIIPALVNTGEAQWLPAAAAQGGVTLHTSAGDSPLTAAVPSLQRITMGSLPVTMGQSTMQVTGRMRAQCSGDFGEVLNLTLAVDSTVSGPCAIVLSPLATLTASAAGASGTVNIGTADGCAWTASSPQPWVMVTPASGSGAATVSYTVHPNSGPARQTPITIAGHPIAITQLAADAKPPAAPATLSAASLNLGTQIIGTTSGLQTVTLTISGAAPSGGLAVTVGGMNSGDFAQSNNCGSAGAACSISVSFTPSAPGLRTAALFLNGNIAGAPLVVNLSGIGTASGPAPAILAVVDAWDYTPGVAPGLWVTIGGTNLGGAPQGWYLNGGQQLPATLGGVTVTFNGTPAVLCYVSSTLINALAPASITPGPVQIVVHVNGLSSTPFPVTAKATQPAVYAPPNTDGSAFFVTAALQGTGFLVGNRPTDARVARAVYPDDVLDLYMIGLGATADSSKFITDQLFAGAYPVSAQVTATVASEAAPVVFAGLVSPGLYLVRISIPSDVAPGQQPLQISTGSAANGGVQTRSSLLLTVQAAGANLVPNGSFESAVAGNWSLSATNGAAANFQRTSSTAADGAASAQVTVTSAAGLGAVQLSPSGIPVQNGRVYRLLFWAKADTARTIGLTLTGASATNEGLSSSAALTGTWQKYEFYFQATAGDSAAQLSFSFGDQTGNTWIDGVELQ